MKENIEFQGIGKNIPYQVPDDFFDQISEKTLQKAKKLSATRRKKIMIWRTVSIAASLTGLALIGQYISFQDTKPETKIIVQENRVEEQTTVQQKQEIVAQPETKEIKKIIPNEAIPEKIEDIPAKELFADVLADLSDEELLQLLAMYKADPFINVPEQ